MDGRKEEWKNERKSEELERERSGNEQTISTLFAISISY